jgi:WD40 repeat protein/tRNA A-37 threonylcarbamoyl transferase component Bud32/ribosomal protein S27E
VNEQTSAGVPKDPERRVEAVAEEYHAELQAGRRPDVAALLTAHPDIADALRRRLALIVGLFQATRAEQQLPADQALRLKCPHCGNRIQLVEPRQSEVTCVNCGSSFHVNPESTVTYRGAHPGGSIGRFQVLELLGRGAFGEVYKARDPQLDRLVAVKIPRSEFFSTPEEEQRFLREARSAAGLRHSGIVQVHEIAHEQGLPYIVSDYIEGLTLADLISGGRPCFRDSAELVAQLADALDFAHRQKVIHRDIKPSNILLATTSQAKSVTGGITQFVPYLTDFGLARRDEGEITVTLDGQVLGTPAYMSPEQAAGDHQKVNGRSDVYSLGVVLYELLSGELPFRGSRRMLLHQVLHDEPRPPRTLNDQIPRDLETTCLKAMAKEPGRRYESAADFADDLRRYLRGDAIRARPVGRMESAWRWGMRYKGLAVSILTITLLLLLISIGSIWTARHFRYLSDHNVELADEKGQLADRNARMAQAAEEASRRTETMLAEMYTSRGILAAKDGEPANALLWFANAARMTSHDPIRERNNRIRIRNWMHHCNLPVGALAVVDTPKQITFRSGGDLLLVLSQTQNGFIWDWARNERLVWAAELTDLGAACWSPDGQSIALGFTSGVVQIRNVPHGETVQTVSLSNAISALTFSYDGRYLAMGSDIVRVWDTQRNSLLKHNWQHPKPVHSLVFNHRGDRLATACRDSSVRVFSLNSENSEISPLFPPIPHEPARESPPVFVDSDRGLVTVTGRGGSQSGRITWWDADVGQPTRLGEILTTPYNLMRVTASPDGRWFATCGYHSSEIWDTAESMPESVRLDDTNYVEDLAFDADGQTAFTVGWGQVARVWSLSERRPIGQPVPNTGIAHLSAFSNDNSHYAIAQRDGLVRVWAKPSEMAPMAHNATWTSSSAALPKCRVSLDGRWLVPGRWHESPLEGKHLGTATLAVLDAKTGKQSDEKLALRGMLVDSCVCRDNQTVAAVSIEDDTGWLLISEIDSRNPRHEPRRLPGAPCSIAAHPNADQLAILCTTGDLFVFSSQNGEQIRKLTGFRHANAELDTAPVQAANWPRVEYTPDGRTLLTLTSGRENVIHVRDADTARDRFPPIRPVLKGGPCRSFAVSPDSQMLATSVNGKNAVQVWDLTTGSSLSPPLPHPGDYYGLYGLCFSPDSQRILTGCKDGQGRLWDWKTGVMLLPALTHRDEVFGVCITPNGRYAVTSARDFEIRLWDLDTGKLLAPPIPLPSERGIQHVAIALGATRVVAMAGPQMFLFDLEHLMSPAQVPSENELISLGELASNRRLELGELISMTSEQWLERWQAYLRCNPNFGGRTLE